MTIKVCKQKLNNGLDNALTITGQFFRWMSFFLIPIGIISAILYPDSGYIMVFALGVFVGFMVTLLDTIMDFDRTSVFYTINRRLKIFEWNEDC